ncbi:Similar to F-box protein YDR306C; acc. no. Q06640 [Pyronema omphalodes CBS 100304]|uniref:Similar to F-box protein YDR306C acc. no. Q06640 n=1 Tax=Pyronema omphalodes (strain CBS 100304) TaxID=1076935 RepID=U4KV05_PYROM|nr:Similar to F-box protein YDR306C; acc. no. Q06640 [Pyronema omphalodes CBS 100304]
MAVKKSNDRLISALETTMSGLTFNTDEISGLVRIEDENGELPGNERPSMLELTPPPTPKRNGHAGIANFLPMEIICLVLEFVGSKEQEVFAATSQVSRLWYHASQPFLYRYPKITGKNYNAFVTTISPSSTNIKPCALGSLVKRLDLSHLVHEGRPSQNARLLRRVQASLEEFVAPQASFGYNCIVALGHCHKLRILDLSLISQAVNLDDLFRHICDLPNLQALNFPRSSILTRPKTKFQWPQKLERFSLSGAILDYFMQEQSVPESLQSLQSLNSLHISHCPFTKQNSIICLLSALSQQLTTLSINYPMPCLAFNALDNVLNLCPNLTYLLLAADYISSHFFDEGSSPANHPLRRLDLDSSGNPGVEHKVQPNDVFIAIAEDRLPQLRVVRVSRRLKWLALERSEDVEDLIEILEQQAEDAGDHGPTGVWEWGDESGRGYG